MPQIQDVEAELAELINSTGKLRMLSHQAVMLLLLREQGAGAALVDRRLVPALDEFAAIAAVLMRPEGAEALGPDSVAALASANAITAQALTSIDRFGAEARQLTQTPSPQGIAALADLVAGDLLAALNATIAGIQVALNAETQRHRDAQAPLAEAVASSVDEVNRMSKTLQIVAMNASIEAQRAGPAGASFGTIAQEMRSLSLNANAQLDRLTADLKAIEIG